LKCALPVDLSRLYRPRSGGLQAASPDVSLFSACGQKLRRMPVLLSAKTMLANHNVKARHGQRQLHIVITAFVPIREILQVKWDVSYL
jgi:hypothetical protein